ncbi:HAMP domain-containing sensor histidine kinase [Anaerotruncus sp.]|jgi:anti-sigma regulatory factor (Ser/Thr protein kinase)|uniref:sensor histidine kinase n=1 Tax=Anaerotruncus TaxID=244127 RepID=UPI00217117FD|nr:MULTISPECIES: HAMP domain-containing sensor histidine kinase [Anaerotruncus]MCI8493035.1 HAMP domain-containing histidine kinase [Anaerotruncus sp.]
MAGCDDYVFFDQFTALCRDAQLPAALIDRDFNLIWRSHAAAAALPALLLPDGARVLLAGYTPEFICEQVGRTGFFVTAARADLHLERPVRVSAFPDTTERFLLTPAGYDAAELGTGMHPEGILRTLSSFSNQYRMPMTVIFSMLTLLSRSCGPQAAAEDLARCGEYINAINQSAFRLLRSCKWITEHMQISYGLSPNRPSRVDLYGHLRELFTAAAAIIEPCGIPVTVRVPDGVLPAACDTEKLGLVIGNLLSNACRFTRPGNRISLRVRRQQTAVSITVSDRGLGIPPDIQPRVFEAYFSYDHGGSPFAGNGLGLTIARSAAALMGGALALTSTPGRGTTVICTVPINEPDDAPPAVFSTAADYVSNRFSLLRVALSDSIDCPL